MVNKTIATKPGKPTKHVKLTKKEIAAKKKEETKIQTERKKTEYIHKRKAEYPKIEEQLDMIYHQGLTMWRAKIKQIKEKYPKPEEVK